MGIPDEAGAVIVAISACCPAQLHASSESDSRHKPFKTRFDAIAKQNKNYLRACRLVPQLIETFATFEEVNQRMLLSGHLLSLER